MQRTKINPEIFDELFRSAANAPDKGQAQFYTPVPFARAIATPLPDARHTLIDLTCGNGQLLAGAVTPSTEALLGVEIDPAAVRHCTRSHFKKLSSFDVDHLAFGPADLLEFAPLLEAAGFRGDLFTLNPPFSLAWPLEKLRWLEGSDVQTVRVTLQSLLRSGATTIDSTLATYLLALHFMTPDGEGLLIANHKTIQRLFYDQSPLQPLPPALHLWAQLVLEGNPCTGSSRNKFETESKTAILYFSRQEHPRCCYTGHCTEADLPAAADRARRARREAGRAFTLANSYQFNREARATWEACLTEHHERKAAAGKPRYNLWLSPDGIICTYVSLFAQKASPEIFEQAKSLHKLNGQTPFALVMQRAERDLLLQHANVLDPLRSLGVPPSGASSPWTVDPALQQAIRDTLRDYNEHRAPLYPLPKIQRLGYLEEEDTILCEKDLLPHFRAGLRYPLATRSVSVTRKGSRSNWKGDDIEVEYSGSELLTAITGELGKPLHFMEGRLRDPNITLESMDADRKEVTIDFSLQELADHFHIPTVPDISTVHPELYQANLQKLAEIEALLA